jgi:uncharacterized membrane protein YdjX (TVP38/TMEM64 family)
MDGQKRARRRLVAMGSTAVTVAVVLAIVAASFHGDVTEAVRDVGPAAPLAFVVLYVVFTLALAPGSALTIAGGVLFGPLMGGALSVVGGAIGATLSFLAGRRLGRSDVEELAGDRAQTLDRWLHHNAIIAIAVVRIIPGVPYSLLNYAAGVTGMHTRDYVIGSAVGLVPGAFVYATVGGTIADPLSLEFAGALALVAVFLAAGALLNKRLSPREEPSGAA